MRNCSGVSPKILQAMLRMLKMITGHIFLWHAQPLATCCGIPFKLHNLSDLSPVHSDWRPEVFIRASEPIL